MKFIAHRGNMNGPNPDQENHPDYITAALEAGFDVELDAWIIDYKVYLGHDKPHYEATDYFTYKGAWHRYNGHFMDSPAIWVHCKNFEALQRNHCYFVGHYFTHDQDDFALTSTGYIWTYPRLLPLNKQSIAVMPERVKDGWDLSEVYGVCTDFPIAYQKDLKFKP